MHFCFSNYNAILLSFQEHYNFSLKGKLILGVPFGTTLNTVVSESNLVQRMPAFHWHDSSTLSTDICAEHRLWPHADECPSLPRWAVPSNQTPTSHHAPVTVAAYSSAHHPQGPGQGGLLSGINISFHTAAVHSRLEMCTSSFELFSIAPCCCLCSPQLRTWCAEIPHCF